MSYVIVFSEEISIEQKLVFLSLEIFNVELDSCEDV